MRIDENLRDVFIGRCVLNMQGKIAAHIASTDDDAVKRGLPCASVAVWLLRVVVQIFVLGMIGITLLAGIVFQIVMLF
jgi:hypothetical protein